jgi:hypothetical protein
VGYPDAAELAERAIQTRNRRQDAEARGFDNDDPID